MLPPTTRPDVPRSPSTESMVTLLPLPLSPTMPSTSPRFTLKDTPPTALTSHAGVKKDV